MQHKNKKRLLHEAYRCPRGNGAFKTSFKSAAKANRTIRVSHKTKRLYVYRCSSCLFWHITSSPPR